MVTSAVLNKLLNQNHADTSKKIERFISNYVSHDSAKGVVIGLSGGLDSSVALKLCVNALGPEKVLGLMMPSDTTPKEDVGHAVDLAYGLGLKNYCVIDILPLLKSYAVILPRLAENKKARGNLMARIRMNLLYYHAGINNYLVVGTSDKSEMKIGYFTKFGDGGNDLSPIGDLYKTQVIEFAKFLNIPEDIINKKSSARLWENQQTEDEIGLSFKDLDSILMFINNNDTNKTINLVYNNFPLISKEKISHILSLKKKNVHKIKFANICNLN